jgi:hypothetical protein
MPEKWHEHTAHTALLTLQAQVKGNQRRDSAPKGTITGGKRYESGNTHISVSTPSKPSMCNWRSRIHWWTAGTPDSILQLVIPIARHGTAFGGLPTATAGENSRRTFHPIAVRSALSCFWIHSNLITFRHRALQRMAPAAHKKQTWHAARKLADPYGSADAKGSGIRQNDFAIELQGMLELWGCRLQKMRRKRRR